MPTVKFWKIAKEDRTKYFKFSIVALFPGNFWVFGFFFLVQLR